MKMLSRREVELGPLAYLTVSELSSVAISNIWSCSLMNVRSRALLYLCQVACY